MASWIIHLTIAQKVAQSIDLNLGRFYLGSLLPDVTLQNKLTKEKSHFRIRTQKRNSKRTPSDRYYDYEQFLSKYANRIQDDLVLGYFVHLFTDEIWAQQVYSKYMIDEKGNKRLDQQDNYYHDYDVLNSMVLNTYELDVSDVLKHMKNISDLDYIEEIEVADISRFFTSLKHYATVRTHHVKLRLFDENDILTFINHASEKIISYIRLNDLRHQTTFE